ASALTTRGSDGLSSARICAAATWRSGLPSVRTFKIALSVSFIACGPGPSLDFACRVGTRLPRYETARSPARSSSTTRRIMAERATLSTPVERLWKTPERRTQTHSIATDTITAISQTDVFARPLPQCARKARNDASNTPSRWHLHAGPARARGQRSVKAGAAGQMPPRYARPTLRAGSGPCHTLFVLACVPPEPRRVDSA